MRYGSWQKKVKRRIMPTNVSIEQGHDLWFVAWRKPRSRPRFLPSQIALYEAQRADQRGDVGLLPAYDGLLPKLRAETLSGGRGLHRIEREQDRRASTQLLHC
jgi:hypothetical protein